MCSALHSLNPISFHLRSRGFFPSFLSLYPSCLRLSPFVLLLPRSLVTALCAGVSGWHFFYILMLVYEQIITEIGCPKHLKTPLPFHFWSYISAFSNTWNHIQRRWLRSDLFCALVAMFFLISLQLLMACYCGEEWSEGQLKLVRWLVHMCSTDGLLCCSSLHTLWIYIWWNYWIKWFIKDTYSVILLTLMWKISHQQSLRKYKVPNSPLRLY